MTRSQIRLIVGCIAVTAFLTIKEPAMAADNQNVFIKPSEIKADKKAPGVKAKALDEHTWAVIFSAGDEVYSGLTAWAIEHQVKSAHLTAVGALKSAILGYYDLKQKAYQEIVIDQQVELLSMIGDFALDKGKPALHAHVVVGMRDGSVRGGHLIEAYASPTTEVFVSTSPVELHKTPDTASGLDLITPDKLN
jgi:uncharacterized protein